MATSSESSESTSIETPGYGWTSSSNVEMIPLFPPDSALELGTIRAPLAKLNESPNVILLYRLQTLRTMSDTNFNLAIITLGYVAVNVVLLWLNYLNKNDDHCGDPDDVSLARCGSPVSDLVFHRIEFAATFVFSVLQAFALLYTPKTQLTIYNNPVVLKLVLFFAIVVSLIPALLVWLNVDMFEIIAHEVEYCNEITMSFVDLVLLASLVKQQSGMCSRDSVSTFLFPLIATCISIFQLIIYNGLGRKPDGGMAGERLAHYCEFTFEIMSAAITFWFCVDNKLVADREIDEIMYGDHRDCAVCHKRSLELQSLRSYSTNLESASINDNMAASISGHPAVNSYTNYGSSQESSSTSRGGYQAIKKCEKKGCKNSNCGGIH